MTRVFNFSAGPAALPEPVLRQAAEEMLDWRGSGMSVMEMSHRGPEYMSIHAEAEQLLRELLAIPANYKVLFLQGGAIGENAIVPMNLLRGRASADYVNTGEWSKKSIKEARKYGKVNVAATGEATNFTSIPKQSQWKLDPDAAYVHICANETIGGVQYHWTPDTGNVPLVADMSSEILSKPIDVSRYGLIYAGAQKNIGPAGLTIVIVRDELIGQALPDHAVGLRLPAAGRCGLDAQHAAHVRDLHRRPGVPMAPEAGRPAGHRAAQPRQGCTAVRLPRRDRLLHEPHRQG
jgi:phosphoserine aminotransferase